MSYALVKHMAKLQQSGHKLTEREQDWFNLRLDRYEVRYGSKAFRRGLVATLDRASEAVKAQMTEDELKTITVSGGKAPE